jgi:hypothetical protein
LGDLPSASEIEDVIEKRESINKRAEEDMEGGEGGGLLFKD